MLTRPITRGITRPITRPLVRQSSAFDPLTLWAQGQQGAFYAPWDLSTLFQDAAGTTPVIADGDPVGLMLDVRNGLPSKNLCTNGDFSSSTGWVGDWSITNNSAQVNNMGAELKYTSITLKAGKSYIVRWTRLDTVEQLNTLKVRLRALDGTTVLNGGYRNRLGRNSYLLTPDVVTEDCNLAFYSYALVSIISDIVIQEIPSVRNDATQSTTAAKPTYRTDGTLHWLEFDGDDDALVANIPGITNATVAIAKSTGTEITYPVDLSSGTFTMNETNYGVIIREGEFTEQEALEVTTYLNAKAGIS